LWTPADNHQRLLGLCETAVLAHTTHPCIHVLGFCGKTSRNCEARQPWTPRAKPSKLPNPATIQT
jgi:hypothetical protein